jgi:GntR family transcriptional regulator, transcriptional repressor for pyruvate dehydrogenase complex
MTGGNRVGDWREPLLDVRSKAERAADAIEERVRSQNLAPGAFLGTKSDLRQQLRVSPATMDTALGVLTDRGVIEVRPGAGGGVRVAAPVPELRMGRSRWALRGGEGGPQRAGQAMTLYLTLQPQVVARAVGQLTAPDRQALEVVRARLHDSIGDPDAYYRAHIDAHHALLDASHDEVLTGVVRTLISILDAETGPARPPQAEDIAAYTAERVAVHVGVIDAVLDGDLPAAWQWLLQHGVTPADAEADAPLLPPGALEWQEQWRRSFDNP